MNDANQALMIGMVGTIVTGVIIPIVTHLLNAAKTAKLETKVDEIKHQTDGVLDKLSAAKLAEGEAVGKEKAEVLAEARASDHAAGMAEARLQDAAKLTPPIPPGSIAPLLIWAVAAAAAGGVAGYALAGWATGTGP